MDFLLIFHVHLQNNVMTMEVEKYNTEMDKMSDSMSGLFQDACAIIEQARTTTYRAVNETLIKRNWLLGMRIQHEVLKDKRAEYGEQVIRVLAKNLTLKYGAGYSRNNLYRYLSFYKSFPNIFQSVSGKSEIVPSLTGQSKIVPSMMGLSGQSDLYNTMASTYPLRWSWTHYSIILQESNAEARAWYENEAANEMWSTRTLQRNVSSQYYHRMLQSQDKVAVHDEMVKLTKPLQDMLEYLKNPVVAEFISSSTAVTSSMPLNTSPICLHKRNFGAKLSNRRSFIGCRMGNEL